MEFVLSGIIGVLIGATGSIIIFNRRRRTERAIQYVIDNGAPGISRAHPRFSRSIGPYDLSVQVRTSVVMGVE